MPRGQRRKHPSLHPSQSEFCRSPPASLWCLYCFLLLLHQSLSYRQGLEPRWGLDHTPSFRSLSPFFLRRMMRRNGMTRTSRQTVCNRFLLLFQRLGDKQFYVLGWGEGIDMILHALEHSQYTRNHSLHLFLGVLRLDPFRWHAQWDLRQFQWVFPCFFIPPFLTHSTSCHRRIFGL